MGNTARGFGLLASIAIVGLAFATPGAANAAPPPVIGSFPTFTTTPSAVPGLTFEGTANFSASSGFPGTTITTNSTTVRAPTGDSAFLGASTGFGAHFGSSRSQPYLQLATASGLTPSTTTITFDAAPPAGWGLAVGDIDADFVQIIPNDGVTDLPGTTLNAQDTGGTPLLNYCNNSPKPSTCAGGGPYTDAPRWWVAGTTIGATSYATPIVEGNGFDTSGAYDWFLPGSSIRKITLIYSAKIGFPSFQLWLVAPAPAVAISGTIALPGGGPVPAGVAALLEKPDGTSILDIENQPVQAPVNPDGTFSITTEQGNYRLEFEAPAGYDPIAPVAVDATAGSVALGTLALRPTAATLPAAPPPELAPTGAEPFGALFVSLLLLAAGAGMVTAARRKRRSTTGGRAWAHAVGSGRFEESGGRADGQRDLSAR